MKTTKSLLVESGAVLLTTAIAACSFPVVATVRSAKGQRSEPQKSEASNVLVAVPSTNRTTTTVATVSPTSTTTTSGEAAPRLPRPTSVAFFSDSIGYESKDYLRDVLAEQGDQLVSYEGYPGTALCTYLSSIVDSAAAPNVDVVLVEFSGNVWGPCMESRVSSSTEREQILAAYESDITTAVNDFDRSPVRLGIILAPEPVGSASPLHEINSLYRRVARNSRALIIDAATYLVDSTGTPQHQLACLQGEPCDDTGHTVVRSPDGLHLCPTAHEVGLNCPRYSSGARRFAKAVAESIAGA
jgi:hypothetical protein